MKTRYDLIIIGAGPAGMAAAESAARKGLSVIVVDEQHAPGGQMYRAIEHSNPNLMKLLGPDYHYGKALVQRFRGTSIVYVPGAVVWHVEPELIADYQKTGVAEIGYLRIRPPIKPITMEQLCTMELIE